MFDKLQTRNFSYLIYSPRNVIVDKTKIIIDVHENINDIVIDTNLVLASNKKETISEAFEEEDNLAVRESDQESRGIQQRILLGSVMV